MISNIKHLYKINNGKYLLLSLMFIFSFVINGCNKEDDKDTGKDDPVQTTGDDRQLGLTPTPAAALQAIPISSVPVYAGTLPPQYLLSFPQPAFQGSEGSCVAFACAYGVMSFHKGGNFSLNDGTVNKSRVYSPEYVYNQTKVDANDCAKGSYLVSYAGYTGALDLLVEKGVCTWNDMPYSYTNGCNTLPNGSQNAAASSVKLAKYERVLNYSTAYLKSLIVQNKPIIIAAEVDAGFMNANSSYIWNSRVGTVAGFHAMIVIGYDDNKNAFRLLNSWGQTWGDNGYTWLDYDYFQNVVAEAYITYASFNNNDNNNDDNNNNNNNSDCSIGNWGYFQIENKRAGNSKIYFNIPSDDGWAQPTVLVPGMATRIIYEVSVGVTHNYEIRSDSGLLLDQASLRIENPCDTFKIVVNF